MQFTCSLRLPADARFVPVARHLCQHTMDEFGVTKSCQGDVAIAITEACANVVEHSQQTQGEFELVLEIDSERCVIKIIDHGIGIPDHVLAARGALPSFDSERGRGFHLIHRLIDDVRFEQKLEGGTVLRLEKVLEFDGHRPFDPVS